MARTTCVYWRDIPAQVIVKAGRHTAKRQLSGRFQDAIDRAAMRGKAADADTYLEDWRRAPLAGHDLDGIAHGADVEAIADAAAASLETDYDSARLASLVAGGGRAET